MLFPGSERREELAGATGSTALVVRHSGQRGPLCFKAPTRTLIHTTKPQLAQAGIARRTATSSLTAPEEQLVPAIKETRGNGGFKRLSLPDYLATRKP